MNELLYTAQDLAIILIGMDLDYRIESAVMDRIWNREKEFLAEPYRPAEVYTGSSLLAALFF